MQIGSRFAASEESSAHAEFKKAILLAGEGDTKLSMKKLVPVRLLKNAFAEKVQELEALGATKQELQDLLGKSRAKRGMFEGDLEEGELEIGQIAASIGAIKPAADIIEEIWQEFLTAKQGICKLEL